MRPQLRCDERTQQVMNLLLNAPASSWQVRPAMRLMMMAGIELLPEWAQRKFGFHFSPLRRYAVRQRLHLLARLLRWSVRQGAYYRAMRRMGR